ncbi:MAG: Na+/H+ antiporter NhaA [Bacteroidota bacterium]
MAKKPKKIEIIIYTDFVSTKARAGRDIVDRVMGSVGEEVGFTYKACLPKSEDEEIWMTAKALLAAEKQHKFEDLHPKLLDGDRQVSKDTLYEVLGSIDIDIAQFQADFESESLLRELSANTQEAEKKGVDLFPALTINGRLYQGALDESALLEAIEKRGGYRMEIAIEEFFKWGASAAFVLLIATIAGLLFVNLGFHEIYEYFRHADFGFVFGEYSYTLPLEIWINDALMALFFLLIGIEIKREVLYGELSDMKRAAMPVIAAIGGMLVPAVIYLAVNANGAGAHGWGVPMATDIAFTLGLMALLGKRVPISLKVFVSALAVADDLGAIVVIAIFYGHGFHLEPFMAALITLCVMAFLSYKKVYTIMPYLLLGIVLWYFVFESGIHATLAGVLTAIIIPSRRSGNLVGVATQAAVVFDHEIEYAKKQEEHVAIRHGSMRLLQNAFERLREPSYYLEHSLEKWVNYLILPLFAFFNTGILLRGSQLNLLEPVNIGIILALCVGKPLGIFGASWIASKTGLAQLSSEISWVQVLGAGCLAGVGFTMSIVVASAAFKGEILDAAKISILVASFISAVVGLFILYKAKKQT